MGKLQPAVFLVMLLFFTTLSIVVLSVYKGDLNNSLAEEKSSMEVIVPIAQANTPGFQEGSIFSNTTLSSGGLHSCAILDNGSVKCWGRGNTGQMGNNLSTESNPEPILTNSLGAGRTAVSISSGGEHTCAILDNGSVICWGMGGAGQMGNGVGGIPKYPPTHTSSLGSGRTAVALAAGDEHTCAILDNGSIVCWGANRQGQLGDGTEYDRLVPTQTTSLGAGRTAIAISAGDRHTCAILDNGSVLCWGDNNLGQLGNGATVDQASPILTSSLGPGRTAVALGSGKEHTCALLDNGHVSCWGQGRRGQIGDGTTTTTYTPKTISNFGSGSSALAVAISSGDEHTCAILDTGSVSCWGWNNHGQSGGAGASPASFNFGGGRKAIGLSLGSYNSCFVLDDGTIPCWGTNSHGERGNSGSFGSNRTVAVSERDLDGDGILNIFDSNPFSSANIYHTNWTISPINGSHSGGIQLNISGDFSWAYNALQNTSSSQDPLNYTWSDSTFEVNYPNDYSIAVDPNDNLHAAWARDGMLEYAVRKNGAWETTVTVEDYSAQTILGHCTIGVDSFGNPHIAYWNGSYLKYTHMSNGTWSQPVVFDQVSSSSSHQALFVDGNDNVHILQHNSSSQSLSLRSHDGVSWGYSVIDNSSYARFTHAGRASLHVDSAGDVHVAYFRENGNADFELIHSSYNGTAWSPTSIRSSLQTSAGVSLLMDSTSTVHVAYGAEDGNGIELTHATFSGGVWSETEIDANQAGAGNALSVDPNDNLYVVYTIEAAAYEVGFATFNGSSWATRNLWVNESMNSRLVMGVDSNHNLSIVYQSHENNGDQLEFLWGASGFSPGSPINVHFSGYGNVTATLVNNTTMTLTSPEGPTEGGNATVTVWFEGQGYEISTPFRFLPEVIDDEDADGIPDDVDDCPTNSGNSTYDQRGCPDSDGDGYSDAGDAFPFDQSEWADADLDGVGDNSDAFPNNPSETSDSDSDGVGDNADVFPNDANETVDSDGDGVGDNQDVFPNNPSETSDSDSDGVGDNADAFPNNANETVDSDGDGVGDNQDVFPNNANETADADGDGLGDNEDEYPFIHNFIDSDEDGYPDLFDDFIDDPTQWSDFDGDGYGDFLEGNNPDAFINNATQWSDTDGDGYGDNWGNETWNLTRLFIWPGQFVVGAELADHCPTEFGNSTADGFFGCPDLDGDGIADMYDDMIEVDATNTTNETNETTTPDTDDDGVEDLFDLCPNTVAGGYVDIDGCLLDEDGDGVDDLTDACPGTPTGAAVNISGCTVENEVEKSFMESLRAGEQEAVLRTVGFGAVLIAVLGFLQTNMVAALLPDSLRWIRVFRTGVKLNQEEIRELEYLKSLVQTYYLDLETLHEELYQLKSELTARYTNSEIKKLTKEKLGTLIDDLLYMDVGEVHRVAHNDAFFGLGGALSTQQRTDYLAQEALMRTEESPAHLPQLEELNPPVATTHPSSDMGGEVNENDGYEYLEHPYGSGNWYFRSSSGDSWQPWNS